MKTLFLIRHAKSSWDDTALPDKDRPLSDRGRRDAPKMGKRLAKRDVKPDLILSSPARRALTTAEIIAKKLDYKRKNIVVEDRLYSGAVHDLLNVVQKLGDKLERVMLFGHNPELTELAHPLSSDITHMPTFAVAASVYYFNRRRDAHAGHIIVSLINRSKQLQVEPGGIGIDGDQLAGRIALKDQTHHLRDGPQRSTDICILRKAAGRCEVHINI